VFKGIDREMRHPTALPPHGDEFHFFIRLHVRMAIDAGYEEAS
jgi:hypothetical protein